MSEGPELVIGLVGAIGTDLPAVVEALTNRLTTVGYTSSEVHVSQLLHDIESYRSLADIRDRETYYDAHMDKGNELCTKVKHEGAMALLALLQIRALRDDTKPRQRHAYIINSLKRPEEIRLLKEVYGDAFVLLGAYASRDTRRDILAVKIAKSQNKETQQCRHTAERLISRDETEATRYGQDVSHTFFKADAFIDATSRVDADEAVGRFVDVLFGRPFETPTRDELGMQHAFSAALRSADLSRQVGAAICTTDGQKDCDSWGYLPKEQSSTTRRSKASLAAN